MSQRAAPLPDELGNGMPSAARLYDYLLGGTHHLGEDRALAERFLAAWPNARDVARSNRAFLRRAVEHMLGQGIRQFLDIGSGIPTVGNVHEFAQRVDPQARVVYVDNEPVAVAHGQILLDGNDFAATIPGDIRRPGSVLHHRDTQRLLDFSEPVGLLMVGVCHFVPHDADTPAIVKAYADALVPGSFFALSHFTADVGSQEMAGVIEVMRRSADPIYPRSRAEVVELFTGFELLEPGVVGTAQWRPDQGLPEQVRPGLEGLEQDTEQPGGSQIYAGVGRKP